MNSLKAYKGFEKDMTCKGFQYEEGKEYHTDNAICCKEGFHACEHPLSVLEYYPPNTSVYHEVEMFGDIDEGENKICATDIKIGGRLDITGLVSAAIEFTIKRSKNEKSATGNRGAASATGNRGAASATGDQGVASATGDRGAASATGYRGAASATGNRGAASATGYRGAASATGNRGAASTTGNRGAASATGDQGVASATGDQGVASATGDRGAASATGDQGAASATGDRGAASADNKTAIAIAWGKNSKAKGKIGAHLVLSEWRDMDENYNNVLAGVIMVRVDGKEIEEDVYYQLKNGKVEKADE